ncbi:MAG: hypothetical protein QM330_11565 [Acidobacteriota bacterium]|jgi:uncharacterized alkaline shock family protein YloU|nr:hypothetical protein [Acidobacteriota bacterium]NLT32383.1 Asp23/Gls24 family envelope stress response protein [Acidobacteriota bacterium]
MCTKEFCFIPSLILGLSCGGLLIETAEALQNKVAERVEDMTALDVTGVNIHMRGLVV